MSARVGRDVLPWGSPPPEPPAVFMSRVAHRRPQWKAHRTLGHARAAVRLRVYGGPRGGEVWRWTGDAWERVPD